MEGTTQKILVIDDERDVTRAVGLTIKLQEPSWQVMAAHEGGAGLEMVETQHPDAVLLDLQMPDRHGFDVLHDIRLFSDVPVIILSVRDDELDKVRGLELGADDYMVKPFSRLELVARLRSVLRRASGFSDRLEPPFLMGQLRIDWGARRVSLGEKAVRMTATEFRLLAILARNAGRVVSNERLLGLVWGPHAVADTDSLKTYVYRLRVKLEDDPAAPRYIVTERGTGYMMPLPASRQETKGPGQGPGRGR